MCNAICITALHAFAKHQDVQSWLSDDGQLAISASYLNTAPSKTCAPSVQSSGLVYSFGLCEIPPRLGTNIILVGTTLLVQAESWPAADFISIIICSGLGTALRVNASYAAARTASMHLESN